MSSPEDLFVLPASLGQQRFWALDQLNPGNPTWSVPVRFRLQGPLNVALLERAFNEIIRRHEVLRTRFAVVDGQTVQVILPSLVIQVPVVDLRHLAKPERDAEADRLSFQEARFRFDLASGPLFRVGLLRMEDDEHILLVNANHSVTDYWSVGVISNELGALYEAYSRSLESPLSDLPIQYGDFAVWQHEQTETAAMQNELAYWKGQLKDLPLLNFPTDHPRPESPTYNATITSILLPKTLTDSVQELANREETTFFNTMLAALSVVLYQYTGQTDFGIGTQVAGRTSVETEPLVGLFINTVVLRPDLSGNPTFREFLASVRETGVQSIANNSLRFEQLLKELRPRDYPSHHTLFRLNFICQRDPVKPQEFAGVKITVIPSKSQGALYDLHVFLIMRNEGWRLACEYNTELFEAGTITTLLANYKALLEEIAANPNGRISDLPRNGVPPAVASVVPPAPIPVPQLEDPKASAALSAPKAAVSQPAAPADENESYAFPITIAQQRFWILEQLLPGSPTLNMPAAMRLKGALDIDVLQRSLNEVVRRHESLRTTFSMIDGQPVQVVHTNAAAAIGRVDLQDVPESQREARAGQLLRDEASYPFVLSKGPLLRATLLQIESDHYILMVTIPHIICDGWSAGIVIRELAALYEAFSQGHPSPLPECPIHYVDFAHWQEAWLKSGAFDEELAYWKHSLQGRLPLLDLPVDSQAPGGLVSHGDTETLTLPADLVTRLKEVCKREEVTMFMLFLAVFKVMLHRYTGQEDILVGSPVAGRPPETENVIGLFSYPISLRTDLSGDPSFRELLHRVRDVTLGALAHKDLPFGRLVEELQVEQVQGRNPLFQVYFLHQVGFLQPMELPGISWIPVTWVSPVTAFDLHLATVERRGSVVARLEYKTEMFTAATIRQMLGHFQTIVEAIGSNSEINLSRMPLLTEAEQSLVSAKPARATAESLQPRFIHELIDEQAQREPNSIAGVSSEEKLSYRDLNTQAGRLSHRLLSSGAGPGSVVGVFCESSLDCMVSLLGTMKAGAAYVWLAADAAPDELARRIRLAGVHVIVASRALQGRSLPPDVPVIGLHRGVEDAPIPAPVRPGSPNGDSIACVQFTAGSTADPKPVSVPHAALLARVWSTPAISGLVNSDNVGIAISESSAETILACLLRGATVVSAPGLVGDSPGDYLRTIARYGCSVLLLHTRFWDRLVFHCEDRNEPLPSTVRLIVAYGERPSSEALTLFRRLSAGSVRLVCSYGTTESGFHAATYEPSRGGASSALDACSLGLPAPGFGVHLLDRYLQPVPPGVTGEICIEGTSLASGYFNNPELTAARFVTHPALGTRLFRTGDLGRRFPDGRIAFLGPPGRHLNLRGFRIHLGEMETVLTHHCKFKHVSCKPSEAPSGDQGPAVYVTVGSKAPALSPQQQIDLRREIGAVLKQYCPEFPQPSGIVILETLEPNPHGRVLPESLPALEAATRLTGYLVPPRDELETRLVQVWEELLGIRPIGITDNFFDLHGHSLLALRLFTKVNAIWGKNFPLSTLFEAPTIEHLAEILRRDSYMPSWASLVAIQSEGSQPPLYLISGLGGNVVRFRHLARYLDPDQPVYALQPPSMDGSRPHLTRLEDMAAHYVDEIKTKQPSGPYHLAGYSFGGLVVFEMARQLVDQGAEVALVALLDAPEWRYVGQTERNKGVGERLLRYRERVYRLLFDSGRWEYMRTRLRRRGVKALYKICAMLGRPIPQQFGTIEDINTFAAARYVPKVYRGRLTLLRTVSGYRKATDDYQLGWGGLATGGVEVYEIPGSHLEITDEPNVRTLAQKLTVCLHQAREAASQPQGHTATSTRFSGVELQAEPLPTPQT